MIFIMETVTMLTIFLKKIILFLRIQLHLRIILFLSDLEIILVSLNYT